MRLGLKQVSSESVQAYIESLCMSANVVDVELDRGQDIRSMTSRDWRMTQSQDQDLRLWIDSVKWKWKLRRNDIANTTVNSAFLRAFDILFLCRGVLYREVTIQGEKRKLPASHIEEALKCCQH